ncbi:hypothetical protein K6T82_23970 [Flavobacterium sp. 17A]|uniref:Lipoprotein n=1 Tax=Flavobacterium potami TaxID=2872310 RepID=A0A9X1KV43_9FLAO|nr:hypothetical protein [Flavobacterium potami]MBZ4037836.1 hypothetical protein [Flavobacterium potami]
MKNLKLLICFVLVISFVSCKKEVSEKDNLKTIKSAVAKKNIEKENFEKEVLPLVQELYEKDSVKYSMINHIAKKAQKEKNKDIFRMNVANLKDELAYYKKEMEAEKK